jgi:hypothetical protein
MDDGMNERRLKAEILRLWNSDLHVKRTSLLGIAKKLGVPLRVVRAVIAKDVKRRTRQKVKLRRLDAMRRFKARSNTLAIWEAHNLGVPLSEFRRLFPIDNSPKRSADAINWIIGLRLEDPAWCELEFGFADPWRR